VVAALGYAALSLAVSSFTTRRAAAAVGVVLVLLVPVIIARSAIDNTSAPDELDLLGFPFVIGELSYRVFDEFHYEGTPIERLSTWTIAAGAVAWIVAGALVCWLRYRRTENYR
jgi:hypothetical protein